MVQSLELCTGAGDRLHLSNGDGGGIDWVQLAVGSEGTLGVITSATCAVRKLPAARRLRGFAFPSVEAACFAIQRLLQRGLRPAVVRLYDEVDTLMNARSHDEPAADAAEPAVIGPRPPLETGALPAWPGPPPDEPGGLVARLVGLAKGKHLRRDAMLAALGQSQLVNRLVGTVAEKIARRGCRMIIGLEGARIRTEVEAALTFHELAVAGARDKGEEPGWAWLRHRYAVSYRMSPVFRDGAFVDTMEVAASWERLLDLYHSVRAAISRHALVMAHFSHAYADGCSIYFTFIGAVGDASAAERLYDAIWRDGLDATSQVGGTISHHHGVGLLKAPFMAAEHREAMAIFEAAKASLDPEGIFNPGKMGLKR